MATNRGKLLGVLVVAIGTFGAAGTTARDAAACGGEWVPFLEQEDDVDYRPEGVSRAEKAFEQGRMAEASASIIRMMPHIRQLDPKSATVVERAMRILAVSTARADGVLPVGGEVPYWVQGRWLGKKEQDRASNLDWSVATLRKIGDIKKDDPAVQTDLAEALARTETGKAEAREILERLAANDLVATPEGYAVLADLRRVAGDEQGRRMALLRCEQMSPSAEACWVRA